MPFPWNMWPWNRDSDLNVAYWIKQLEEISRQAVEDLTTLEEWKTGLEQGLETWKSGVLTAISTWENEFTAAMALWKTETEGDLNDWKTDTQNDIATWESDTLAALNAWKAVFLAQYETIEQRVDAIVSSTQSMVENLAPVFNTNQAYKAGDFVVYNGILYQFLTDHSPGTWNAQEMGTSTMSGVATDILNGIGQVNLCWESGAMLQATGVEYDISTRCRTPFIPVDPGEIIVISRDSSLVSVGLFEFASNLVTTDSVNTVLTYSALNSLVSYYAVGANTHFIRLQANYPLSDVAGIIHLYRDSSHYENVLHRKNPVEVSPEMFKSSVCNTDAKMLQAAINFAFEHKCDIILPRMYVLADAEYLLLNKYNGVPSTQSRYITRIKGAAGPEECGIQKNYGNVFTANSAYKYSGDFVFKDLTFKSTEGSECNIFNMNVLMRMIVEDCFFKNVDSVAKNSWVSSDTRSQYWQDISFKNCTVIGGKGWAFYGTGCYATSFEGITLEHRDGGIRFGVPTADDYYSRTRSLIIRDSIFEGISGEYILTQSNGAPTYGTAIYVEYPLSVLIEGCYFEKNYKNIIMRNRGSGDLYSAEIRNCWLSGYFFKERYGTQNSYTEIRDDTCILTIGGTAGDYQVAKCASERGGIINAPAPSGTIPNILYLENTHNPSAKGEKDYTSFTYDANKGVWIGSNAQENLSITTGTNNNITACKTYTKQQMT